VLWDLRYALQLKKWQCPAASRIHTMMHVRPPWGAKRPTVLMATDDNLVAGWEVGQEPRCTLILRASSTSDAAADAAAAPMGTPTGGGAGAGAGAGAASLSTSMPVARASSSSAAAAHSVRALLAPMDGSCVLSASTDTRLRCWRLVPGEAGCSFAVGGQPTHATGMQVAEQTLPSGCRVLRELPVSNLPPPAGVVSSYHQQMVQPARAALVGAEDRGCLAAVTSAVYASAPHPGLLLAGSLDGTVRVWK
jgi:hypothetical protein